MSARIAIEPEQPPDRPPAPTKVTHVSLAERAAAGKAARTKTPRTAHAELPPAGGRDPVTQIEQEGVGRLPELLPIRYGRMLSSPFAFYRGTAGLMALDLSNTPTTGLRVQLCGDAHLSNLGGYASPDRDLVFDLNDFDETLPGPFEWDVKRMATSFEIAGRYRGFTESERRALVLSSVLSYRQAIRQFAAMGNLEVWYSRLDATNLEARLREQRSKAEMRTFERATQKARSKDSTRALTRLTVTENGEPRILSQPPLLVPIDELVDVQTDRAQIQEAIRELLRSYRATLQRDRRRLLEQYRFVDMARKVVGVGSVGTRCWIVLLLGRDANDPLVLQVKEASASVLEPYLNKSQFANHGQRVVEGQRLMQAASDIFLGWIRVGAGLDGVSRDFYVRQLWDWKIGVDVDTIRPDGLSLYAQACGWTLARGHARSGDSVAIASYLGRSDVFDRAVAEFSVGYADVAEQDFHELERAAADGRIPTQEG